jgi:hypothetical protein
LKVISDFVKEQVTDDMEVVTDLGDQYLFPTCLAYTDLRPDLVIHSELTKTAVLVELSMTLCFKDNFADAKARRQIWSTKLKKMVSL